MMDAIQIGRVTNKTSRVYAMETHTWPDFAELLTRHTVKPGKDGPGWVPGPIQPGPRTAARIQDWCVLALDIEAPAKNIGLDEPAPPRVYKRLAGQDVAPALEDVAVDLELLGWGGALYTSYSHQEPALTVDGDVATLGPRYRVVLPVSRPVKSSEIRTLGLHVLGVLGLAHVADVACLEPARLFYFASCPPERKNLAQARIVDGEPLDVNALLREASAAAAPARKTQSNTPSASVINSFNGAADVGELLERYGYKRKGRNRWMWPGSTTGMAGVYVVPGTQRVVSRHSNDPLHADGKSNDAFGVWCELEHGGDYKKAVRAASKMLGMERNRNGTEHQPACSAVPFEVDPDTGEILMPHTKTDEPTFPPLDEAAQPRLTGLALLNSFALNGQSQAMRAKMLDDVHILGKLALMGQITAFYTERNGGKTLLTLWLLIDSIKRGVIDPANVYYINSDDTHKGLVEKTEFAETWGFKMLSDGYNGFKNELLIDVMRGMCEADEARGKVFILDTLKKFTDVMKIEKGTAFMQQLRAFALQGGSVILLGHVNKHRGDDGKLVYKGTTDVVDDCDCYYIMDKVQKQDVTIVTFENGKARGDVVTSACYSFQRSREGGQTYAELLDTVQAVDDSEVQKARDEEERAMFAASRQAVIDAIFDAIGAGKTKRTDLINEAHHASGVSKVKVTEVLDKFTGHHWQVTKGQTSGKVYSVPPDTSKT